MNHEAGNRIKRETSKAYAAFVAYRDMGTSRSLSKAAGECNANVGQLERWSRKYNWVERVSEWDTYLDEERRKVTAEEVKAMTKRHIRLAEGMLEKSLEGMRKMDTDNMKPADIARLGDTAVKLERLARGLASDKQNVTEDVHYIIKWQD